MLFTFAMKTIKVGLWFSALLSTVVACGGEQPPAEAPPTMPSAAPPAEPLAATPAPTPAPAPLKLQVFTGTPEGFLVNSTLVSGQKDAILIDTQFTLADAKKVAEAVKATGKTLTTVYVTHSHPDHYFGFPAIKEVFPNAKLVALPVIVTEIQQTWEGKVKQWKPLYKDAITATPVVPEPLAGTTLELEGEKLEVVGGVQGDDAQNSYVWIPSLKAAIVGDIAYYDVFPWTAETNPEARKAWLGSIDRVSALNPAIVVPGHQTAEKKPEPATLTFTKDYLVAYDEALTASKKPTDLQAKIKAKYPTAQLDIILKIGSEAAFKAPAKPAPVAKTAATPAPAAKTAAAPAAAAKK